MALALVFIFIVVPLVELYVIIQVGGAIGLWPTIALLILDSILGTMLLRSQGRAAWARFNEALANRRPPAAEVFDGAMIILGGAFLLTPGFITDIIGLCLLLPPTRAIVRRFAGRMAKGHVFVRVASWGGAAAGAARGPRGPAADGPEPGAPPPGPGRARSAYDYEGDAQEITDDREIERGRGDR
jgi:UPF0716 protein FxsA